MFCKNCGTEINGTTRFCPGCGAKVEQKPDSSVCPSCGAPVKAGAKFCENCGAILGGERPAVWSPAPPAVDDPNRPVCPYCGMQLASMDDHCSECALQAVTMQEYLDSWVCPECSEVLSKGYSCPYCGKKAVLRRSMSAHRQPAPAAAPQPAPALASARAFSSAPAPAPVHVFSSASAPAPAPAFSSAPAQRPAAAAPAYCPACGAALTAGAKFCLDCGAAVNRPSAPALKPLPLPKRAAVGGAAPVATTEVTSATITDGAPVAAPMRKPEVGQQQTPRKASDRMKQQAGTAARQAVKTVFQKILEVETPASSLPGETRTTLNSEQMSVLSTVARSLFRR